MKTEKLTTTFQKYKYVFLGLLLIIVGGVILLGNNDHKVFTPPQSAHSMQATNQVSLFLGPVAGNLESGGTLNVAVRVNSLKSKINAVQAVLNYPTSKLEYVGVEPSGSNFDVEASTTGGGGKVQIVRGKVQGVTGDQLVATVTFKVLSASGTATLSFGSDSAVLDASSNNNILGNGVSSVFNITQSGAADADVAAPSSPAKLMLKGSPQNSSLSWEASQDNVAVAGYKIYRNGLLVATTADTQYVDKVDSTKASSSSSRYQVSAFDTSDNDSVLSSVAGNTKY